MKRKAKVWHYYFKRAGLYEFARKSLWKALLSIAFLILGFIAVKQIIPVDLLADVELPKNYPFFVYAVFFLSESLLGLLPPDAFIYWTTTFDAFWWMVGLLAVLSYLAGFVSYKIGKSFKDNAMVQKFLKKTFDKYRTQVQKWGGFVIVIAALTPLPFSPISMLAGSMNYPFKKYYLYASTRLVRYFIYAWFIVTFT